MMNTFDQRILSFITNLKFSGKLPADISLMNPYQSNQHVMKIVRAFYKQFYNDNSERHLILGINPGRLGAGVTGIPFTDTKRLASHCNIILPEIITHEPSSVFVYEMIDAYGGAQSFYNKFYISSISPLGFLINKSGKSVNYNYYDSLALQAAVTPFAVRALKAQLAFGISRKKCFVFGTGKNHKFIESLNTKHGFFDEIIPLEHPRYIMQYKSKNMAHYLQKYLEAFNSAD